MTNEELNHRIAEEVMGWTFSNPETWDLTRGWRDKNGVLCRYTFNPAGKISHSWLVVEEMERRGFRFSVGYGGPVVCWGADFEREDEDRPGKIGSAFGEARAQTAPIAICLAALEAVGGEP